MKIPRFNRFLSIGISFFALVGCEDTTGPEKMLPLESGVVFQVYEGYGAAEDQYPRGDVIANPRVALRLRTTKEYSCGNWEIVHVKTVSNNRVRIRLLGRSIGSICYTTMGPAKAMFFLDLGTGVYELTILYGNETATFSLSVTDSTLSVASGDEEAFAVSEYSVYWRHPQESFAYFCGTTIEARAICDEFVERLAAVVPIEEFSFPPHEQPPWPLVSDGHYYDAPTRFFRYTTEADFQAAGAVLETYAREVIGAQQGIGIWLWSWRNDRYLSWLYREP